MERKRYSKTLNRERVRPQRMRIEPPPGVAGVDGALWALKTFTDQVKCLVDDAERLLNDVARNQTRELENVTVRNRPRHMPRPARKKRALKG